MQNYAFFDVFSILSLGESRWYFYIRVQGRKALNLGTTNALLTSIYRLDLSLTGCSPMLLEQVEGLREEGGVFNWSAIPVRVSRLFCCNIEVSEASEWPSITSGKLSREVSNVLKSSILSDRGVLNARSHARRVIAFKND